MDDDAEPICFDVFAHLIISYGVVIHALTFGDLVRGSFRVKDLHSAPK